MKNLIFLLFTAVASHCFAQNTGCDSIAWNTSRKLTWDDFKGKQDAGTNANIRLHYNFSRSWAAHGATLKTKMVCFFSPCKSWFKGKRSPELLSHEQGSFDIAEYFRRLYNKKITEAHYSPASLPSIIEDTYGNILTECATIEKVYDSETNYSINMQAQQNWDLKIKNMLNSMDDYSMEEVTANLLKGTDDPYISFNHLLERAHMSFTAPASMIQTPVITNGQMNYNYALQLADKNYEVRYAIRPLDTAVKRYEYWKVNNGNEIMADPNKLDKPAFTATMMNISGGKMEQPAEFPDQAIRNCFNADWGCINVCQPVNIFGKGYAYCMAIAIHKDNIADAYIFLMVNDRNNLTKLLDIAFYSLKFKQ